MKVAVVGAGVLGISTALHLLQRGAEVTVIEAVGPGAGTSSRGAGLVSEGAWHPTSLQLIQRSIDLLAQTATAAEARGSPFRFHQIGSTTLVPEAKLAGARRLAQAQRGLGVPVRELAPEHVATLPRHAGMDLAGVAAAFHYPRDGWALPRQYCDLSTFMFKFGGGTMLRAAATLRVAEERAALLVDGARVEEAEAVVLAAGIHTRALLQGAGLDAPLLAYRTQAAHIVHARAHEAPILHDAVQGFYMRPGRPGHLLAGNGTTTTPEDTTRWRSDADPAFVEAAVARVRRRFPFMRDCAPSGAAHAGLDTATPDRLMLAGRFPQVQGLWLAVGGNGHGFMRAPALGESLAALILGERPRVDLTAYDPTRFAGPVTDFVIREGYTLDAPAFK